MRAMSRLNALKITMGVTPPVSASIRTPPPPTDPIKEARERGTAFANKRYGNPINRSLPMGASIETWVSFEEVLVKAGFSVEMIMDMEELLMGANLSSLMDINDAMRRLGLESKTRSAVIEAWNPIKPPMPINWPK